MPTPETTAILDQLHALDADDQQNLAEVGEQFGTSDVLRQLERFHEADRQTGAIPASFGFTESDKTQLGQLAAAITDASGVRLDTRVARSTSTDDYREAVSAGKSAVRTTRAVLSNTVAALGLVPGADSKETRSAIRAALDRLGAIGRSKTKLQEQLRLLITTLGESKIAGAAAERGGADALTALAKAIETIAAKTEPAAKVPGTPADTRRLNLLEGLAVSLLRRARAAARAWASAKKDPTLARPYELEFLYAGSAPSPAVPTPSPSPAPSPTS